MRRLRRQVRPALRFRFVLQNRWPSRGGANIVRNAISQVADRFQGHRNGCLRFR